jgi:hypothetical protein
MSSSVSALVNRLNWYSTIDDRIMNADASADLITSKTI